MFHGSINNSYVEVLHFLLFLFYFTVLYIRSQRRWSFKIFVDRISRLSLTNSNTRLNVLFLNGHTLVGLITLSRLKVIHLLYRHSAFMFDNDSHRQLKVIDKSLKPAGTWTSEIVVVGLGRELICDEKLWNLKIWTLTGCHHHASHIMGGLSRTNN